LSKGSGPTDCITQYRKGGVKGQFVVHHQRRGCISVQKGTTQNNTGSIRPVRIAGKTPRGKSSKGKQFRVGYSKGVMKRTTNVRMVEAEGRRTEDRLWTSKVKETWGY